MVWPATRASFTPTLKPSGGYYYVTSRRNVATSDQT